MWKIVKFMAYSFFKEAFIYCWGLLHFIIRIILSSFTRTFIPKLFHLSVHYQKHLIHFCPSRGSFEWFSNMMIYTLALKQINIYVYIKKKNTRLHFHPKNKTWLMYETRQRWYLDRLSKKYLSVKYHWCCNWKNYNS